MMTESSDNPILEETLVSMPERVLVADDEHMVASGMSSNLSDLGYEVIGPANNGESAIQLCHEHSPDMALLDIQMPKLDGIEGSANDIGFVTYQVYGIVRDLVDACIAQTPDVWKWTNEVALVGGVMINRKTGGDFFQPLSFEARRPNGQATVDLYEQTFGKPPDLVPVLGSEAAVRSLYEKKPKATVEEEAGRAAKAAKDSKVTRILHSKTCSNNRI